MNRKSKIMQSLSTLCTTRRQASRKQTFSCRASSNHERHCSKWHLERCDLGAADACLKSAQTARRQVHGEMQEASAIIHLHSKSKEACPETVSCLDESMQGVGHQWRKVALLPPSAALYVNLRKIFWANRELRKLSGLRRTTEKCERRKFHAWNTKSQEIRRNL